MDFDSVSVRRPVDTQKKEHGQYPAILTSPLAGAQVIGSLVNTHILLHDFVAFYFKTKTKSKINKQWNLFGQARTISRLDGQMQWIVGSSSILAPALASLSGFSPVEDVRGGPGTRQSPAILL